MSTPVHLTSVHRGIDEQLAEEGITITIGAGDERVSLLQWHELVEKHLVDLESSVRAVSTGGQILRHVGGPKSGLIDATFEITAAGHEEARSYDCCRAPDSLPGCRRGGRERRHSNVEILRLGGDLPNPRRRASPATGSASKKGFNLVRQMPSSDSVAPRTPRAGAFLPSRTSPLRYRQTGAEQLYRPHHSLAL